MTKNKKLRKANPMQITDIKVRKTFEEGPLKAVVSLTLDDQLAVHDVKVIYARDRYFVVMPSRKNPDGTFRDMVHPINASFRAELESAIISAYHEHVANSQEAVDDAL
jgi:stage V sporulation protein G